MDENIRDAVKACEQLPPHFGRFSDPLDIGDDGQATFEWSLASNEHARFYESAAALADGSSRPGQGISPSAYYIVDIDYAVDELPPPARIEHLQNLATLVNQLSQITQVVKGGPADPLRLLFVIPADEKAPPKTVQLVTEVSARLFDFPDPDLTPLRALTADGNEAGFHQEERRALFRLAVADVLGEADRGAAELAYLVERWNRLLVKYQYDVDAYISRFSFDKVRKEISQAELDFVDTLQGVVGDGATKLLGLPLSLAAVIGIYHATSFVESLLLSFGALLISVLFSGFTENQRLQLSRISDAFDVVFDPLTDKLASYPASVSDNLRSATEGFGVQLRFSQRILATIRVLGWIPTFLAVCTVGYRYNPPFRLWLDHWADRLLL